jgi:hypothetical protein
MSDTALKHVEYLANMIGPRGSTTPEEKKAHDYAQSVLGELGCNPRTDSFLSLTAVYWPYLIGLGVVLIAEAIYWLAAPTENVGMAALMATILAVAVTASILLELQSLDNPLRWFSPTAPSQNVIGVTPASGEAKRKLAVMAHVDTHRTPLIWRSRNTFVAYRAMMALALISLILLCGLYGVSIASPGESLRRFTLVPTLFVALGFLVALQPLFTKFSPGANDNASGVGVMLALAERLKAEPLANTEVWWAATGCEEAGGGGSADFVRRYGAELKNGMVIVVDNIAGKETGPVYLRSEALLLPTTYPAETLAMAAQTASAHPELGARSAIQQGAYTDGIHLLKAGIKCLTFVGYTQEGWIPNWHQPSDTFANVDADSVDRAERFVWALVQKFDQE